MRITLCAVVSFVAITVSAAAQDLTIISKVTTNGAASTSTSYMSKDHMRMAHGDGKETIMDVKTGQMTTIDTKKKTYYVTTKEDMDKFMASMQEKMNSPEMKAAQAKMNNMSAADRAKMDKAMAGMFSVNVEKTGATKKIAGYSCEEWAVTIGAFSKTEECLTTELQFPTQVWGMYRNYADSMKNMMAAMGPMAKSASTMAEQMKKMKGYPLANKTTVDVMGQKTVVATEVTDVKRGSIPDAVWAIPAGYTKIDNPMMKAFDRHKR